MAFKKLYYPMTNATIAAGFMNAKYKTDYGYPHYGVDYDSLDHDGTYGVLSIGDGKILGVEKRDDNSLGGIVVIRYDNVYVPLFSKVQSIIARYYHIGTLYVKGTEDVFAGQIIGNVDQNHKWWNHIHLELDTDVQHPFHTPQVREESSNILIRKGATDETLINPAFALYVSEKQTAMVHPKAIYATKADAPRYRESEKDNFQRLVLPMNNSTITAGYKNEKYAKKFGFGHFGIDMVSNFYSSVDTFSPGSGTVIEAGYDKVLGNVVSILYRDVYNHKEKNVQDVVMRLNHMANLLVKKGETVEKGDKIGKSGNTGKYSQGIHLHIEIDKDAREKYACYTPTISYNSNIMKHGADSTINPADVFHKDSGQTITRLNDGYSADADIDVGLNY